MRAEKKCRKEDDVHNSIIIINDEDKRGFWDNLAVSASVDSVKVSIVYRVFDLSAFCFHTGSGQEEWSVSRWEKRGETETETEKRSIDAAMNAGKEDKEKNGETEVQSK